MKSTQTFRIGYEQQNEHIEWLNSHQIEHKCEKQVKQNSYIPNKTSSSHVQPSQLSHGIYEKLNSLNLEHHIQANAIKLGEQDIKFFSKKLLSLFRIYTEKCEQILQRSLETEFSVKRQRGQFIEDPSLAQEIIDMNIIISQTDLIILKNSFTVFYNAKNVFYRLLFKLWPELRDEAIYFLTVILFQITQIKSKKNEQEIWASIEDLCQQISYKIIEGYRIEQFVFKDGFNECEKNLTEMLKEWVRIFITIEVSSSIEKIQEFKEGDKGSIDKENNLFEFGSQYEDQFSSSLGNIQMSFPRKRHTYQDQS